MLMEVEVVDGGRAMVVEEWRTGINVNYNLNL